MYNWRQSPAAVLVSVLLLLVWVGIHLSTFVEPLPISLKDLSTWNLILTTLTVLVRLLFVPLVPAGNRQRGLSSDRRRQWRLWPIIRQSALIWLLLAYMLLLLYLAFLAPDLDGNQRGIYQARYFSAFGVYLIWTWLPGMLMNRRQAGDAAPASGP